MCWLGSDLMRRTSYRKSGSRGRAIALLSKGMDDLPNLAVIKYFRPFGIQSDFGYAPALGGHTSHHMFADGIIEYLLPFLSNNVRWGHSVVRRIADVRDWLAERREFEPAVPSA
jgi:hypothetical protein